ncbi:MAG: SHOCT domain-containing protein [Candidatus Diapherotrites archaeon]
MVEMRLKSRAIFIAFILFFSISCFAVSYEELPKAIEVIGVVQSNGEVLCTAKIHEHATLKYLEQKTFEDYYYLTLFDAKGNGFITYEFPVMLEEFREGKWIELEHYPFHLIIPFEENVFDIKIAGYDEKLKCIIVRSPNAPKIEIKTPSSGGTWEEVQKIEWEMSDEDKDWLLVDVYWADNTGLGWELLEKEVDGTELNLINPVQATRIKVVANDGFNSTESIVESSKAEGNINSEIEFEEKKEFHMTNQDDVIDLSKFIYGPIGKPDGNGGDPPPIDLMEIIFWVVGLIVLIGVIALIGGLGYLRKGKTKKEIQKTETKEKAKKVEVKKEIQKKEVKEKITEIKKEKTIEPEKEIQKAHSQKDYSDAMKVLRKRFAEGKISKQEFNERKKELEI